MTDPIDYDLPPERIAQQPAQPRGSSRLLVIDRQTGALTDAAFADLETHLPQDSLLVFNDTQVIAARLLGRRAGTGGRAEVFLLRRLDAVLDPLGDEGWGRWEVLVRASKAVRVDQVIEIECASARILEVREGGVFHVELTGTGSLGELLDRVGHTPLPPYIAREDSGDDRSAYQTVFAERAGAVAAPTAGLHFTREHLAALESSHEITTLTLHVGLGTFLPIRDDIASHVMHEEHFEIPTATADAVNRARKSGRSVVAVGTTSCRALEAAFRDGEVAAGASSTDLFITPGYDFRVVDALITNFHLPRSTLLLLVSAFASPRIVLDAYAHAIAHEYRFYSYGDATLMR